MQQFYDKKFKTNVDAENQTMSISIKVSDGVVSVFKASINEFNIMISEYQAQLNASIDNISNQQIIQ